MRSGAGRAPAARLERWGRFERGHWRRGWCRAGHRRRYHGCCRHGNYRRLLRGCGRQLGYSGFTDRLDFRFHGRFQRGAGRGLFDSLAGGCRSSGRDRGNFFRCFHGRRWRSRAFQGRRSRHRLFRRLFLSGFNDSRQLFFSGFHNVLPLECSLRACCRLLSAGTVARQFCRPDGRAPNRLVGAVRPNRHGVASGRDCSDCLSASDSVGTKRWRFKTSMEKWVD